MFTRDNLYISACLQLETCDFDLQCYLQLCFLLHFRNQLMLMLRTPVNILTDIHFRERYWDFWMTIRYHDANVERTYDDMK